MKLPTPTEAADQAALTTETNDEWRAFLDGVYWVMGLVKKDAALLAEVRKARKEYEYRREFPETVTFSNGMVAIVEGGEIDRKLDELRDQLELESDEK